MSVTIAFTYTQVTPESAEHGDSSDNGFWTYGGWRYSVRDGYDPDNDTTETWVPGSRSLRDALEAAGWHGIYRRDGSDWWESDYDCIDFWTDESLALHVDGITEATRRRIDRVLNGQPVFG